MSEKYFHVTRYPNNESPIDIGFSPINVDPIPKKYLDFKSEIEKFVTTINILYADEHSKKSTFYEQAFFSAQLCFSGSSDDFVVAVKTLADIKDNVLSTSWIKIRNKVLVRYGVLAIILMAFLLLSSLWLNELTNNLPIVLAGSCLGSWVSMAIRIKELKFEEIASSVNEMNSPILRVFFVCALTTVITILLFSGFLEINIGGISSSAIHSNQWIAFSIGSLFGFSEKSLVTKLTDRSEKLF